MTALQMNPELLSNLNIIASDETMLNKVTKYVRKLVKQMSEDPTCMSKQEYFARLDEAEKQIAEGKGITFTNPVQMNSWLNAL